MFTPFLQLEKTENNDKSFECCAVSNPAATATTTSLPTTNNVINPNTFLDMAPRNASTASATSAAAATATATAVTQQQQQEPPPKEHLPVLVVGAGPVGLACALALARQNVPVRIIDKAEHPTPPHESRALALWLGAVHFVNPVDSPRAWFQPL
jgi:threonine dehydrogenase-like Zn-dependent dehydrogenase